MASLARLKRSSVDLLQLHNRIGTKPGGRVMTVEQILGKNGVADGLDRLREKGLIRHMGITAIGEAASVCEVIRSRRFDSAQVYYNLLNPSAGRSMPEGVDRAEPGRHHRGLPRQPCRGDGDSYFRRRRHRHGSADGARERADRGHERRRRRAQDEGRVRRDRQRPGNARADRAALRAGESGCIRAP